MTKFVIMGNAHEYGEIMCGDIMDREDVVLINKPNNLKSKFGKFLDFLLQELGKKTNFSVLPSVRFRSYVCGASLPAEDACFIFFDSNAHAKDKAFLQYIREKYNARIVLYVMNPSSAMELNSGFCNNFYDLVFTVFARDADAYGWHACTHLYSKIPLAEPADGEGYKADVFFAGRAKNRLQDILRTYEFLAGHDVKCDFHIVGVDKKQWLHADDIMYNEWLPYREMIQRMHRSRCILEILQQQGTGPTLRMTEAIVYNKKIITNDALAASHPFYNQRYVRIFDTPENIDLNFIKENIDPDYHYGGQYSAKNFLKLVGEKLAAGRHLCGRTQR